MEPKFKFEIWRVRALRTDGNLGTIEGNIYEAHIKKDTAWAITKPDSLFYLHKENFELIEQVYPVSDSEEKEADVAFLKEVNGTLYRNEQVLRDEIDKLKQDNQLKESQLSLAETAIYTKNTDMRDLQAEIDKLKQENDSLKHSRAMNSFFTDAGSNIQWLDIIKQIKSVEFK